MIRAVTLSLLAAALPLFAAATPARAELTLCNRTSYRMQAAIGIERRANVETRGWFRLDPGECRKVVDGPLDADMTYVHARSPAVYGPAPLPQCGDGWERVARGLDERARGRTVSFGSSSPGSSAAPGTR